MSSRPENSKSRAGILVASLLLLYLVLAVSATTHESPTMDETLHLTLGYLYWTQPTDKLQPENGIFSQAWAALPLLFDHLQAPPEKGDPWDFIGLWGVYYRFLYSSGNDLGLMLLQGRTMIALLGVALGALVYGWSRELFGIRGGLISLVLFVFCPITLAHGALITTDMAASLALFASTFFFWKLTHHVTWLNLAASILSVGMLVLTKMSSVLLVPIFVLILAARIVSRVPVQIHLFVPQPITASPSRLRLWVGILLAHLAVVIGLLWLAYDFTAVDWQQAAYRREILHSPHFTWWSTIGLKAALLQGLDEAHLLPHSYVEGLSFCLQAMELRNSFLWGNYSDQGWWWFFPFVFLVKTPLSTLLLFLSAMAALICWRWLARGPIRPVIGAPHRPRLYDLMPLLILGDVYGVACITSHLNLGQRHLLPLFPVLFVLAGANVFWLLGRNILPKAALVLLLFGTLAESWAARPYYLGFFNQLVGGSRNGYLYLVDSSLDWGQGLPDLKKWLDQNAPPESGVPVYFSYFGAADPAYYDIRPQLLPSDLNIAPPQDFPLHGGIYCVSATMLQLVYHPDHPLLHKDPRFARLCAFLRQRPPDDEIGYAILIYRLSDDDIARALGAAPEK